MTKKKKAAKKKAAKPKNAATVPSRTITITGKFGGGVNNRVILDVFRSNSLPHPFDFRKTFVGDFTETINDLKPGLLYKVDLTGHTTTQFDLTISGQFGGTNPINDSFQNTGFSPGFSIKTNS